MTNTPNDQTGLQDKEGLNNFFREEGGGEGKKKKKVIIFFFLKINLKKKKKKKKKWVIQEDLMLWKIKSSFRFKYVCRMWRKLV